MAWLFGSSKKEEKKAPNPEEAMKALSQQIENIDKRQKVLENKSKKLVEEALKLKKSKNTKGAVLALKKRNL